MKRDRYKIQNLAIYVQQQIDLIFKFFKNFARAYVNDVVIFFNFLKKYLHHFIQTFTLFEKMNVIIKVNKTFLKYSTIALFD